MHSAETCLESTSHAHEPEPQVTQYRDARVFPRGLRREVAAAYVGVSPSTFDGWVKDATMPKPIKKGGVTLWDRHKLDAAFDALSYHDDDSEWDDLHV